MAQLKGQNVPRTIEARFFDETDILSKEHREMMNERIKEMRSRFYMQALALQEAHKKNMVRLANFERLKPS